MSEEKAFPRADGRFDSSQKNEQGMTLRDYFAAMAMDAFLSRDGGTYEQDADCAYKMADAMLKAREA